MFASHVSIYLIPVIAAAASAGLAYILTPFVRALALRLHAVDVPSDERRMHTDSVPQIGGLAIFLGAFGCALAGRLVIGGMAPDVLQSVGWTDGEMLAVLAGSLIILVLGIVDDIRPLSARLKLPVQAAAALIVVAFGGLRIDLASDLLGSGFDFLPGWLSWPVTVIWILAVTNGLNFIDGLDGLACGVGGIASFALFLVLIITGNPVQAVLFSALGGACLGFLPYNVHPAKIFMGDTGATFLGFVLGGFSIMAVQSDPKASFFAPVLALSLPLFDLAFAVVRRVARGMSPFEADSGHIHHRLIRKGLSVRRAVTLAWGFTALEGFFAVVSVWWQRAGVFAGLATVVVFALFVVC